MRGSRAHVTYPPRWEEDPTTPVKYSRERRNPYGTMLLAVGFIYGNNF